MKLFDKIVDVYYDWAFGVTDLFDTVKYKIQDLVEAVRGQGHDVVEEEPWAPLEVEKPKKKKKKTSKKKK